VFLLLSSTSIGTGIIFIKNEQPSPTKESLNMSSSEKKNCLSVEYENFVLEQFTVEQHAFAVIFFQNLL
jgi:hypothetical protein